MNEHPYRQFEGSAAWQIIDQAISDLVDNNDIREMTARRYIVGYLVKHLVAAGLVKTDAPS